MARREATARWPELAAFLIATVHREDDRPVQDDVDREIASTPLAERQRLASEWWDWNLSTAREHDVRFAIEAFNTGLAFDTSEHARAFMNNVYDRLIVSVRREVGESWRPEPLGYKETI